MKDLKIGQAASATGLTTKTIRYYELLGLLQKPARTYSGYRTYHESGLERLRFIKKAKGLGLSLIEIKDILTLHDQKQQPCVHVLALLDKKLKEIDTALENLQAFRKDIRFLRHDDGDLEFIKPHLREEIVKLIRELTPGTIITHDPYPGNGEDDSCSIYPDHITVGAVTFQSACVCAPGPLFYPEHLEEAIQPFKPSVMYLVMSAQPSFFIDITDVWQFKLAAIRKHESQGRNTPENDRAMEGINGENGARAGVKFAEAFRILLPS